MDLAKAFGKVDIGVTHRKLELLGIRGLFGRWLLGLLLAVCQKWSKLVTGANHTMYICATFQVAERQRRDAIS